MTIQIKKIHHRNVTDLLRKRHRIALEGEWIEPPRIPDTTPSQYMVRGERALRLAQMLQSLPEMQREAVRLRYREGWRVEQIARELDRSVAATAGLIKRGLQELREKMSKDSWL